MAYQKQIWENLPSQNTPVNADRLNHMEDGIYEASTGTSIEVHNEYSTSTTEPYSANYVNALNGKMLWTNPNPNNNFAATQITLSSGDYEFLEIYYYEWSGDSYSWKDLKCAKVIKGYATVLEAIISYNSKGFISARRVRYTNATNLQIDTCYSLIIDSAFLTTPADAFCVPVYIIGYKTELF